MLARTDTHPQVPCPPPSFLSFFFFSRSTSCGALRHRHAHARSLTDEPLVVATHLVVRLVMLPGGGGERGECVSDELPREEVEGGEAERLPREAQGGEEAGGSACSSCSSNSCALVNRSLELSEVAVWGWRCEESGREGGGPGREGGASRMEDGDDCEAHCSRGTCVQGRW